MSAERICGICGRKRWKAALRHIDRGYWVCRRRGPCYRVRNAK